MKKTTTERPELRQWWHESRREMWERRIAEEKANILGRIVVPASFCEEMLRELVDLSPMTDVEKELEGAILLRVSAEARAEHAKEMETLYRDQLQTERNRLHRLYDEVAAERDGMLARIVELEAQASSLEEQVTQLKKTRKTKSKKP